ncbi:hypothetical protein EVAR_29938_1 [Eumeta japonica]|uniref:F-box domain-containing protein n=1 Tax=Eumeta variegata TaxID=151549 RepID=A0A4C1VHH2_EUMVA|nr:hypothetical protein EVAR_29938_1 [Eumeta japonica]
MDVPMDVWGQLALEASQVYLTDGVVRSPFANTTIEKLPDKVLLNIFSYLSHREICRMATVCKRWRLVAYDTRLWTHVSLRPEISGLHVGSLESLLALISIRFGPSLRYIELPIELITHTVLHELAAKCPNLTHMLLDFSTVAKASQWRKIETRGRRRKGRGVSNAYYTIRRQFRVVEFRALYCKQQCIAMQLHDFSEMQAFPTKLRYLCICLSEVIFMEGFMRKIYNFINGLEILHLIGTYEKVEEEEEEIYEVINVHKLKSATPNLRVINLYGINFVDDSHIDAFSSNCIQGRAGALNNGRRRCDVPGGLSCPPRHGRVVRIDVTGSTMKTLFQRSRRLTCLLMSGCSLQSEYVTQVEWEKSSIQELDVTATDLSTDCLIDMLSRIQNLRFLSAGQINGFNDSVLKAWMEAGTARLRLVFSDLSPSLGSVYTWFNEFKRGLTNLTDDLREGRPSTAMTEDNIGAVRLMMETDKRVTCQQIQTSLGIALDVDSSDNLTDDMLHRFLSRYGCQLWGLVLSGMPHITDQLWQSILPALNNAKILVMGTQERLGVNIHVDQLMDGIANKCPNLERLELRWDPENLRFSDKSQKAIDVLRVKCLKLKCLVLSDGRYYEIVKANFERADRTTVVRTSTNCRVSNYYLLSNYKELIFN